jgi:hypothetical protein
MFFYRLAIVCAIFFAVAAYGVDDGGALRNTSLLCLVIALIDRAFDRLRRIEKMIKDSTND